MSKYTKICLMASLLLNLFLLGITFGYTGKSWLGCKISHHMHMADIVKGLPADKQQALQPVTSQAEHDIKQQREHLYEERRKAANILQAKPFDKEAYLAEVRVIEKMQENLSDTLAAAFVQIASQCTDEERAVIARTLVERINQSASSQ